MESDYLDNDPVYEPENPTEDDWLARVNWEELYSYFFVIQHLMKITYSFQIQMKKLRTKIKKDRRRRKFDRNKVCKSEL